MANESVSKLIRVRQGGSFIMFEQTSKGLVIEHFSRKTRVLTRFTLKEPVLEVLRELLHAGTNAKAPAPKADFQMEEVPAQGRTVPPEGLQGRQTEDGLVRSEDGIEAGME